MGKQISIWTMSAFCCLAFVVGAPFDALSQSGSDKPAERRVEPKKYKIGDTVKPFELKTLDGKTWKTKEFKGKKDVLVVFWSYKCPVANACDPFMETLGKEIKDKDVAFLAINANANEAGSTDEIKAYQKKGKYSFPVAIDPGSKLAKKFGAERTPHFFLIDKKGILRYAGAPHDGRNAGKPDKTDYLRTALAALNKGEKIQKPVTKAVGCGIKWPRRN